MQNLVNRSQRIIIFKPVSIIFSKRYIYCSLPQQINKKIPKLIDQITLAYIFENKNFSSFFFFSDKFDKQLFSSAFSNFLRVTQQIKQTRESIFQLSSAQVISLQLLQLLAIMIFAISILFIIIITMKNIPFHLSQRKQGKATSGQLADVCITRKRNMVSPTFLKKLQVLSNQIPSKSLIPKQVKRNKKNHISTKQIIFRQKMMKKCFMAIRPVLLQNTINIGLIINPTPIYILATKYKRSKVITNDAIVAQINLIQALLDYLNLKIPKIVIRQHSMMQQVNRLILPIEAVIRCSGSPTGSLKNPRIEQNTKIRFSNYWRKLIILDEVFVYRMEDYKVDSTRFSINKQKYYKNQKIKINEN